MNKKQFLPSRRPPSREGTSDAPKTELAVSARARSLLQGLGLSRLVQDLFPELFVPYKDI